MNIYVIDYNFRMRLILYTNGGRGYLEFINIVCCVGYIVTFDEVGCCCI